MDGLNTSKNRLKSALVKQGPHVDGAYLNAEIKAIDEAQAHLIKKARNIFKEADTGGVAPFKHKVKSEDIYRGPPYEIKTFAPGKNQFSPQEAAAFVQGDEFLRMIGAKGVQNFQYTKATRSLINEALAHSDEAALKVLSKLTAPQYAERWLEFARESNQLINRTKQELSSRAWKQGFTQVSPERFAAGTAVKNALKADRGIDSLLVDSTVWGEKAASYQKITNEAWSPVIGGQKQFLRDLGYESAPVRGKKTKLGDLDRARTFVKKLADADDGGKLSTQVGEQLDKIDNLMATVGEQTKDNVELVTRTRELVKKRKDQIAEMAMLQKDARELKRLGGSVDRSLQWLLRIGAGRVMGGMLGGPGGLLLGHAASNILDPLAGMQLTVMMNALKKSVRTKLDDISERWAHRMVSGGGKSGADHLADLTWKRPPWFRSLMSMAGMSVRRDRRNKEERDERKKVRQKAELSYIALTRLTANPERIAQQTEEATQSIASTPNTREAVQQQLISMSHWVLNNLPLGMSQGIDLATGQPKLFASDMACQQFLQVLSAVNDPLGVLDAFTASGTGNVPPSVIKAVKACYPELYRDLALSIEFNVADQANKVSMKKQKKQKKDLIVSGGIADQLGSGGVTTNAIAPLSTDSLIELSHVTGTPKTPFMAGPIINILQAQYRVANTAPAPGGSSKSILKKAAERQLLQSQSRNS